MLVLSRKVGERLLLGDDIVVTVNRISGNRVAIGIEAPRDVSIVRGELNQNELEKSSATPQSAVIDEMSGVSIASCPQD